MRDVNAYKRAWYAKNRGRCAAYKKKWLQANPERTAAYRAKWKPDNKRRREKLRQQIDAIKSVPCMDCGIQYPPRVMEFDHRNQAEKTMQISHAVGKMTTLAYQKKVLEETKKCDIVCANCHRLREIKRDSK